MKENRLLQALYTVFLGVLIALFIGVGISTFYEAPQPPDYPQSEVVVDDKASDEQQKQMSAYDEQYKRYEEESNVYNRNVSIISLVAAVVLIVIGLLYEQRIKLLAGAVMLGGIFTLLYSIGRGFAADDKRYVFMVLTVSLVVVFYLGYRRFVQSKKA